jgi:hypothetical protein
MTRVEWHRRAQAWLLAVHALPANAPEEQLLDLVAEAEVLMRASVSS